ncbi:RHS repeat-associated core domain-containing protein [Allorhodopirellula heiligendammensis]|uniref:Deoxyribonuclease RhsB n=1 Tax=Allorhodopirellula heiligendammensis TaxID=2714739 RepID=A0A5C6B286_9BACT|nr:RHS repeat-associated core domain-containing protein [Allorhodopirellula heiligendammensis]TWU05346.1 putative deoxyribonuclease RhsB [Allorhodopirellula heiligendammensis]
MSPSFDWPLTDHLGSVRDVAEYDAVTGITSIANHIVYDSFGKRISETNAAVDSLFGYTGREWDDDVDLQHNRARCYDPATGRWLSNDPIGFAAGDANLYRYVTNMAIQAIDPSGRQPPADQLEQGSMDDLEQQINEGLPPVNCDPYEIFGDIAEQIFDDYKDEIVPTSEEIRQFVKDHPWSTLGLGIAAGTAAGVAINDGLFDSITIPQIDLMGDLEMSGEYDWKEELITLDFNSSWHYPGEVFDIRTDFDVNIILDYGDEFDASDFGIGLGGGIGFWQTISY